MSHPMKMLRSLFLLAILVPGLAWGQARVSTPPFNGGNVANPINAPGYQAGSNVLTYGILYTSSGAPANGGNGYVVNDVISLSAGTCAYAPTVTVKSVSASPGPITAWVLQNPGQCSLPNAGPLSQSSTSGSGSGATFTVSWGPITATVAGGNLTAGNGNFVLGGFGPAEQAGYNLLGSATENTFIGDRAGTNVTSGGLNTAVGHNALGIGGPGNCPITGGNMVAVGNDALRNFCNGSGNTAVGRAALMSQAGTGTGLNAATAIGNGALQFLNSNGGTTYVTALGAASCPGVNGTANFKFSTCLGGFQGSKLTTAQGFSLIGFGVGNNTFASGSGVILIGSGNVAVDTPAAGTSNYINIENILTVTGTNTPSTSASTIAGTLAVSGITTDATHTDATVCEDTTTHQFYFGSGTLGVCLGTSSLRYKRDWHLTQDGLVQVMALKPGNYFYKPGHGDNGAREQYGFLAEDMVKVLPKLTQLDARGKPNSVDIVGLVPVMVKAMQQQQSEIAELRQEIKAMRHHR